MSDGAIFAVFVAVIAVLILVVGFIGNKIVDKGSDALHRKFIRGHSRSHTEAPERLKDRFEKGHKL